MEDLKRMHGGMTDGLVPECGKFRSGEEDVFDGDRCILMATPAKLVTGQMNDLFEWMNREKGNVHPLIMSSVFHCEFVFIHPFADGNGRMTRLWQTAIEDKIIEMTIPGKVTSRNQRYVMKKK